MRLIHHWVKRNYNQIKTGSSWYEPPGFIQPGTLNPAYGVEARRAQPAPNRLILLPPKNARTVVILLWELYRISCRVCHRADSPYILHSPFRIHPPSLLPIYLVWISRFDWRLFFLVTWEIKFRMFKQFFHSIAYNFFLSITLSDCIVVLIVNLFLSSGFCTIIAVRDNLLHYG